MKTWIYSWVIYPLLYSVAMVVGLFKQKVRDTLRLRSWKDFLSLRFNVGQPIDYWLHVASQGELEYAIPILQALARRKKRVLVTYYSISAKNPVEQLPQTFPNVSLVVPLPHDGLGLMKEFVSLVHAQGVRHLLLLKYELWPGLLWECNAQGIKVLLVDALKPGWFHRRLLHKLDGILSGYSSEVASIPHNYVKVVGDTRVERVLERFEKGLARLDTAVPAELRKALSRRPVLVCGSMWPADSKLLFAALRCFRELGGRYFNIIWVPHELDADQAKEVSLQFGGLGFNVHNIEDITSVSSEDCMAVIVMKKGILAELYRLGQAAYVGGGFGSGVHSVWEPALSKAWVACGPKTERSPESEELATRDLLERMKTPEEFAVWMKEKLSDLRGHDASDISKFSGKLADLLPSHIGAAERIVEVCEELRGK